MMFAAESVPVGVAAVFVAVLVPFGGFVLISNGRWLLRIWKSRNWVETPCEVLSIREVGIEDFSIEISYAYRVGATTHQSNRFSFTDNVSMVNTPQFMKRYPTGCKAVCYVNPADSADAVFRRSVNIFPAVLLFVVGAITTAMGVFMVFLWASGRLGAN
ncbi:MAG: DUF3592 domain-containing protein [Planctomycetes bacterium]|nr:DUF3592 domain-containing protein [Planctomycetota bacterium]